MTNQIADLSLDYSVTTTPKWNVIDATKIKAFMSCPRRFFYEYVLGWKPAGASIHLVYGEAVHAALEHLFEHGHREENAPAAYEKFLEIYREHFAATEDDGYAPKDPTNFMNILFRYIGDNKRFNDCEVIYVEGRENKTSGIIGTVPINEDTEAHFKMDVIVRQPNGKVQVIEHKTAYAGAFTGKNREPWAQQWNTSTQVALYLHALYCMFDSNEIEGILVNGISPAKGENKYIQVPVSKSYAMLNEWLSRVNYWVDLMRHNYNLLAEAKASDQSMAAFPCNDQACTAFGGCPMLGFCSCWPNPIAKAEAPPLGWRVEYWDPRDKAKSEKDIVTLELRKP